MLKPKISVFTTCFNAQNHIIRTLDSIKKQTFQNYEVVIQDGFSKDKTLELIDKYYSGDNRFKVFSKTDKHAVEGLNSALNKTSGEYLMYMSISDEYEDSEWFDKCVDILDKNQEISLVHGNDIRKYPGMKYGDLRFPEYKNHNMPNRESFLPYWLATYYHISELNYCVRRKIYFDCYKQYQGIDLIKKIKDGRNVNFNDIDEYNPLLTFTYNFIKKGYLPYHIPTIATSTFQNIDRLSNTTHGGIIARVQKEIYMEKLKDFQKMFFNGSIEYRFRNGNGKIIKNLKVNKVIIFLNYVRHALLRKKVDFGMSYKFSLLNIKKKLNIFFHPKRFFMKFFIFKYIRFYKHYLKFIKINDGRFNPSIRSNQIEINDWGSNHEFDRHYLYHTSWATRLIYKNRPKLHIDISSDIRFASLVSTFTDTEYYDIRKLNLELSRLSTGVADLRDLPFETESVESISCMHVVEHCGLGRYSDKVEPRADIKSMSELMRVLKPGGKLYFVIPIAGKSALMFNAHRIYSYKQIIEYFSNLKLIEFSLIPDNSKDGNLLINPPKVILKKQKYGCGCFLFSK